MNNISSTVAKTTFGDEPYSTKRHRLTPDNCDSEPVQTPGCVQAHGALLVLRLSDLRILQASDNAKAVLGQPVERLLGEYVSSVIGEEGQNQLQQLLAKEATDGNPQHLLTLPVTDGSQSSLDVTAHTIEGVIILEFESSSRTGAESPDYFVRVKKTVARLQTTVTLKQFCDAVADEIRALTGMDRVMVYKFHADGHGEVIAESKLQSLSPWLGLHYPAEDIPKPAREMFTKTWIRPVPDVSDALAELVPLVNPDNGKALNMTYCALRGVSLMYTEYLRNMEVAAALTLAIRRNGTLWGLIACHHYAGPKYVPFQVRAACEFLAQVVSLQHRAAEDKEHAAYRQSIVLAHQKLTQNAGSESGLERLQNNTAAMLDGIHAGGVALRLNGQWSCAGNTPTEPQLDDLSAWLIDTQLSSGPQTFYATEQLGKACPDAAAFAKTASGLLAVPLSLSERSVLLWFRPETLQTVNWGGNPNDKPVVLGPNGPRLTPRHSFELFIESVRERSLPWTPVEIESAISLRVAIVDLLAGQVEHHIDSNAQMARSNEELDAFAYVASHDLKEPLHGIHQYANQLLQEAALLGGDNRGKLDRLVRLTVRMDSLLDSLLHFSRIGGAGVSLEAVDLNTVVAEAWESVGSRNTQGRLIVMPRPLPIAHCNPMRCRQVFANLLSNALKYSDKKQKQVEVGYIAPSDIHARPGCPDDAATETIYYVADNGIGIHQKSFKQVFKLFKRLHGQGDYGGGTGAGLAIVEKLVAQHGGKVWVDSTLGGGSTFYFTLPTDLARRKMA